MTYSLKRYNLVKNNIKDISQDYTNEITKRKTNK